jgi:hypothetical protein
MIFENINFNEDFQINAIEILNEAYTNIFDRIIGWSELPFCARKIIIKRLYKVETITNPKMLLGSILHATFQAPAVLNPLLTNIFQKLRVKDEIISILCEKETEHKIQDGRVIKGHIDVYTNLFAIEMKFTNTYVNYWTRELTPYYFTQLNGYLGSEKLPFGFLMCINVRMFQATFTTWEALWNKYGYLIPVKFNQELFNASIERANNIFDAIKKRSFENIEGPEFEWECKYCNSKIREICGKEEYKCQRCKKKSFYEFPKILTDHFIKLPQCEGCFKKINPHSKYIKFKYKNYKEREEKYAET